MSIRKKHPPRTQYMSKGLPQPDPRFPFPSRFAIHLAASWRHNSAVCSVIRFRNVPRKENHSNQVEMKWKKNVLGCFFYNRKYLHIFESRKFYRSDFYDPICHGTFFRGEKQGFKISIMCLTCGQYK